MTPRDHHHLNRVTGVALLAIAALVAAAQLTDEPVRDDAEQLAPRSVRLSEVAVDPGYSTPTPAPSEPAWQDSTARLRGLMHACVARLSETPAYARWKEVAGVRDYLNKKTPRRAETLRGVPSH